MRRGKPAGDCTMGMILDRRTGDHHAMSWLEVMIRSGGVNTPPPLTLRLGRCEADPIGGSTVPEHRTSELPSACVGEDHPGVDVGVGVGDIWSGEGDVDFTPLRGGAPFDKLRAHLGGGWGFHLRNETRPADLAGPALPASATFPRIHDRDIDTTCATARPEGFLAETAPSKLRCSQGRHLGRLTYLDFAAEEIGLCLNDERRGGGSAIGSEEP
jgi:hypothetical protein